MAQRLDGRWSRRLLAAWLAAAFVLSAVRGLPELAAAAAAAALLFRRGLGRALRRTARAVLPATGLLALLSYGWLRLQGGAWPDAAPFAALALRACLVGFLGFAVLDRVDLAAAAAPWPALGRLLAVALGQAHALRLLVTESRDGLRSRVVEPPGAGAVLRGAGPLAAAMLARAARDGREIAEAMRSRGIP